MAITKRKNLDEDKSKPGRSKRSRVMSGGDDETSKQEMDEKEPSGKRTKEEPNGQEPPAQLVDNDQMDVVQPRKPPEVNAIYRRDIASFLPREKVEEWRLTSQFSDAALSEFPSKLPRRCYCMLEIATWSGARKLGKNGFVDNAKGSPYGKGKAFQTIFDFRFCCKGFEGSAQILAGELIFPGKREDDVVLFRITPGGSNRQAALRILNRLTKKTAFSFLHFVWHAGRNCYYESISFDLGELATTEEGEMNPTVLHTIRQELALEKPFRFRALYIDPSDWSEERVGAAQRLVSCKQVSSSVYHWDQWNSILQRKVRLFAKAGGLSPKAEMWCSVWVIYAAQLIDPIIQNFRDLADGLGSSIADIHFTLPNMLLGWPTLCPKEQAIFHEGDSYVFQFNNTATQEGFKVALRRWECKQREWVSGMHLTIDR